jgi:hypothetical protein
MVRCDCSYFTEHCLCSVHRINFNAQTPALHLVTIRTATDFAETTSFEAETKGLQDILKQLPDDDHRSILSQLMIMANARGQASRVRLALQVRESLAISMERSNVDGQIDKATHLIFHLALLKKSCRKLFGTCLFKAMSKLYTKAEKHRGQQPEQAKLNHRRRKSPPPPTIAIQNEEGRDEDTVTPTSPTATEMSTNESKAPIEI